MCAYLFIAIFCSSPLLPHIPANYVYFLPLCMLFYISFDKWGKPGRWEFHALNLSAWSCVNSLCTLNPHEQTFLPWTQPHWAAPTVFNPPSKWPESLGSGYNISFALLSLERQELSLLIFHYVSCFSFGYWSPVRFFTY